MSFKIDHSQQNNEETTKLRYITPAIEKKWDNSVNIIMEYYFTDGRISVDEYNIAHRSKPKKADYLLMYNDNVPLAIVEAKSIDHRADEGYAQAVDYARILDVPYAYATNGDDLIERNMITGINKYMKIADFPTKEELWERFKMEKTMSPKVAEVYSQDYYITSTSKKPRYYQRIAINRAVEAILNGKKRLLLVLATGTGKTFTSFQIIYRFWKNRTFKKILYLADRNCLVDQTMRKDFKPFMDAMEKIDNKKINTSKEIFLGLYQQLKSADTKYYEQLPRDFFDLIIVDECHRGSASVDSNWHDILTYFDSAVQIGMTATPKDAGIQEAIKDEQEALESYNKAKAENDMNEIVRTRKAYEKALAKKEKAESESNAVYFGNPIYTYSLKQGIEDGFLAPYKVISVELNIDKFGWLPPVGTKDINGEEVERRTYFQEDFDRKIISLDRRKIVAKKIGDFLKTNDARYEKTIVFCEDIAHCEEMVRLLENENADIVKKHPNYIVQITGDNEIGKAQLENFISSSSKFPVIAVTSRLLSTGVDTVTCRNIVFDRNIGSMTEFKQALGRGTRVLEKYECDGEEKSKMYFNVLDFRKNYLKFNDPLFDGTPVTVIDVPEDGVFPKPPVKPTLTEAKIPRTNDNIPKRLAKVNGIDVEIIGEDVLYYDNRGNLVTQDITACTRNNIISQYSTFEDFHCVWLLAKDKKRFANELLIGVDWKKSFEIQYGYTVDDFDIIAKIGYDIEPPTSKKQRTQSAAVALYLDKQPEERKKILKMLLDTYAEADFESLKSVKEIFSMSKFNDIGLTPLKAMKCFGGKEKYFEILNELENKLYE